jgi:hypothetical protein
MEVGEEGEEETATAVRVAEGMAGGVAGVAAGALEVAGWEVEGLRSRRGPAATHHICRSAAVVKRWICHEHMPLVQPAHLPPI